MRLRGRMGGCARGGDRRTATLFPANGGEAASGCATDRPTLIVDFSSIVETLSSEGGNDAVVPLLPHHHRGGGGCGPPQRRRPPGQ